MDEMLLERFQCSLIGNANEFGVTLTGENIGALTKYYALLARWNERLHLVAPCEPEEFAQRHVLESLVLLKFLPDTSQVIDVGSGGGLPIIPCLLVRAELRATLVESSQKKSVFLREVISQCRIASRGIVVPKRYEEVDPAKAEFVTSRALDNFLQQVSTLIRWAPDESTLLLFGGPAVREKLDEIVTGYKEFLIPGSEQRFLFEVRK